MSTLTNGIGWFEVGSDAPDLVEQFYGTVFGWTFASDGGPTSYRFATTPAPDSIKGGVFPSDGKFPNYAIFYVVVEDVAASCVSVEAAGGKVVLPRTETPYGLVFAHVLDPSGNRFGIYTPPPDQDS